MTGYRPTQPRSIHQGPRPRRPRPDTRLGTRLAAGLVALGLCAALAPAAAAAPGPAAATTAAADDQGTAYGRMMLLLDSSGSMAEPAGGGQTKIVAAKSALRRVVGSLPSEAQVGLRVFGATVFSREDPGACEDSQQVVTPGVDNRDELLAAVDGYEPFGETPIPHALEQAAADLGKEGARSIVLVSDGESTCAPDPCETAADLAEDGIDLQIDVVGLSVSGAARDQLRCIAEQGGGTYYDVDSAAEIEGQLTRVAQRAVRPFTLAGEPIVGGPESDPTPVTVGDWVDKLGPAGEPTGSKSYLVERTIPGSTLRLSAVGQGRLGDEGLRIEVVDAEGDECDTGSAIRQIDARDVVGVQAVAGAETDCDADGSYVVTVSRRLGKERNVSFGLRVAEEPPVEDPGFVSSSDPEVAAPTVSGAPQPVIGGTSFANATPISTGRWSSTVVPGEAQMYSFPLEFGQSARIRVAYPRGSQGLQDVVGRFPPFTQITAYNPMQALLEYPRGAEFSGSAGGDEERVLTTATGEVSRDSIDAGGFNGVADYSMAGAYYLAISMGREDYTAEVPFTIELEVVGTPQPGPTYADGATWTVADGATVPEESEDPSPTTSESPAEEPDDEPAASRSDDDSGAPVAGVLAGVAGVLALVGAFVLWRRRAA
jgi:Ca-activated chloride channel family protein